MRKFIGQKIKRASIMFAQLSAVLLIFYYFFGKDIYSFFVKTDKLKTLIEKSVKKCGPNYFISWIVVESKLVVTDAQKAKRGYHFNDVIGCNPYKSIEDCVYSVKKQKLNPFYDDDKEHVLDKESYDFLNLKDSGVVAFYDDVEQLKKYQAIRELLNSTNKKVNKVGFSVIKDSLNNIIYVFTLVDTGGSKKCDKHEIVEILENISLSAKEVL